MENNLKKIITFEDSAKKQILSFLIKPLMRDLSLRKRIQLKRL